MQRFRSVALFAVVQFALVLGPLHAHAAGSGAEVPVTPAPDWVTRIPIASSPADAVSAADGIVEELVDDEIRVGAAIERYRHRVQKLTSTAGVEIAGQVEISFDPSYEHLSLHSLVIGRGDQRIDALKRASIRVLQQESDLDEQVYNGALTALVVVKDLRVGDTLDLEYTLTGANPVFGGRLVDSELLASPHGAERLRVRLLTPAGRSIAARTVGIDLAPSERVSEGLRELVWERRAVPPARLDDQVPSWFVAYPYLSFSELPTWGDVARWATPLFAEATAPAPAVTAKAAEIAASSGSAEERALAALRFVQDDVRYLGIEMGANSHRPHDATQVLEQRFGDCKDKAVLLVSLLRALGLEAEPALVDAGGRARLVEAPISFRHQSCDRAPEARRARRVGRPDALPGARPARGLARSVRSRPDRERRLDGACDHPSRAALVPDDRVGRALHVRRPRGHARRGDDLPRPRRGRHAPAGRPERRVRSSRRTRSITTRRSTRPSSPRA